MFCSGNGCQVNSTLDSSELAYVACCPDDARCAVPTSCRSLEDTAVDVAGFELDNVMIWYSAAPCFLTLLTNTRNSSGISSACQTLIWSEFTAFAYECGMSSQAITINGPAQTRGTTGLPSSSASATETAQPSPPTDGDGNSGSGEGSLYSMLKLSSNPKRSYN